MDTDSSIKSESRRIVGIAASRGIAIAPAFRYRRTLLYADESILELIQVDTEIAKFETAISKARNELEKIRRVAEQKVGSSVSAIFEAQMMMISDEFILSTIRQRIKQELRPAAYVLDTEMRKHQKLLQQSDNETMRARADDIEDIKQRLLRYLMDREKWLSRIDVPSIVVAEFLTPADAILFARANVLGFAIDAGGVTSHVSILARSLGIPAVVALHNAAGFIETGDYIILDGERGELITNPDAETRAEYEREKSYFNEPVTESVVPIADEDFAGVRTRDGRAIGLGLNLEFGSESAIIEAERISHLSRVQRPTKPLGLGLIRTEHFLLLHDEFPNEEEQNALYRDLAERFYPAPITLRTFDVGGDKVLSGSYHEENPFLGWRGLRISLDEPELFSSQLRAILRASSKGNVKLLFPMITNVGELKRAIDHLEAARAELRAAGEAFDEAMKIGAMIEVPSAALMASAIVQHVDFLSIGTNDLTQYTLAVDRGNDLISGLYDELHPAVLRLVRMTIEAAHTVGKPVSVCGELGAYPLATAILLGLGVDELSVAPTHVRALASRIKLLSYDECATLAKTATENCDSPGDVKNEILTFLTDRHIIDTFAETATRPAAAARLIKR